MGIINKSPGIKTSLFDNFYVKSLVNLDIAPFEANATLPTLAPKKMNSYPGIEGTDGIVDLEIVVTFLRQQSRKAIT